MHAMQCQNLKHGLSAKVWYSLSSLQVLQFCIAGYVDYILYTTIHVISYSRNQFSTSYCVFTRGLVNFSDQGRTGHRWSLLQPHRPNGREAIIVLLPCKCNYAPSISKIWTVFSNSNIIHFMAVSNTCTLASQKLRISSKSKSSTRIIEHTYLQKSRVVEDTDGDPSANANKVFKILYYL